jgi:hypothetical protein
MPVKTGLGHESQPWQPQYSKGPEKAKCVPTVGHSLRRQYGRKIDLGGTIKPQRAQHAGGRPPPRPNVHVSGHSRGASARHAGVRGTVQPVQDVPAGAHYHRPYAALHALIRRPLGAG